MSLSSGRGQVVNNADQRGPWPIEPIDLPAPLRHGEYHCSNLHGQFTFDCTSRVQWSEQVFLGPCSFDSIDPLWSGPSVSCRFQCMVKMSTAAAFEGRAAVCMERVEVSISAVPAATHVPVSVTSYYFDTNTTCGAEYALHAEVGFHFHFYSRNGRPAGNYMQMKTVSIKHDPRVGS